MKSDSFVSNFRLVRVLFLLFFILIVAQLGRWQILEHSRWNAEAELRHELLRQEKPIRGKIISSDGFTLAVNEQVYGIYVIPQEVKDIGRFTEATSSALSLSKTEVLEKLTSGSKYVALKHKAVASEVLAMLRIDCEINGSGCDVIELSNPVYFAIRVEKEDKRVYPEGTLACHVLGFVGADEYGTESGKYGVEGYYNGELEGEYGYVFGRKDQQGRIIVSEELTAVTVRDGMDIYLTIDRGAQKIAERVVKDYVNIQRALSGTIIAMRPSTGEIIALANYPVFDPNSYWAGESVDCDMNRYMNYSVCIPKFPVSGEYNEINGIVEEKVDSKYKPYLDDQTLVFKNEALGDLYEPGSVIKILTVASGLDAGVIEPESKVEDHPGCINVIGRTICTWNKKGAKDQTIKLVLINSDNIGAYYIARKIGADKFYDYLDSFGVGHLVKPGMEGESSFGLKMRGTWNEVDLATAAFGQGVISVTPLQLLSSVNTVANGGVRVQPHIVSKFIREDEVVEIRPVVVNQPISKDTAYKTIELLKEAIEQSYLKKVLGDILKYYTLAGKTGTAQVPMVGGEGYYEDKIITTFVGWVPAHNPEIIILARLKEPEGSLASVSAVPMWAAVTREMLAYLNIPPDRVTK